MDKLFSSDNFQETKKWVENPIWGMFAFLSYLPSPVNQAPCEDVRTENGPKRGIQP